MTDPKLHVRLCPFLFITFLVAATRLSVSGQGTTISYQGRLDSGGAPFNGNAEVAAVLWDSAVGGSPVGTNSPQSVIVAVTNGLFNLPMDFGSNPFATGAV